MDVTLIYSTNLNIAIKQVHPFRATVKTVKSFSRIVLPVTLTTKIVQERFEKQNKYMKVLTWPSNFPALNLIKELWNVLV